MNTPGIICIETEWEHTIRDNRLPIHTEPLLEFIKKAYNCKVIYRRVATYAELAFYLRRFNRAEYNDYDIFYLSFHGDKQLIQLEGEKENNKALTLKELAEVADGAFEDRMIHFSSCRTMRGYEDDLLDFKEQSGARLISGYTKSVNGVLSAINDIAFLSQLLEHPSRPRTGKDKMDKYYEGLGDELGFRVI